MVWDEFASNEIPQELWAQSGHDWAAFIEALKAEHEPIF